MTPLRRALLSPQSVALIGASDDTAKTASRPLRYLRQSGYAGRIYPINPRRETVLGEKAWPSLAALPEIPDHAYIVAPAETVTQAIEECGRAGVSAATILASGFGEAGEEGKARERQLREAIARYPIRVVGPSSLGVVNVAERMVLTANAAFAESDLPPGKIFVASQSGSMIGALVSRGKARGIGFSGLVSVGNEIDLSIGEICETTLDDAGVDTYLLFLETIRKGEHLRRFAIAAARRGKPVLAYKLGRSEAAAELSVSHTGALAGEDDVADAFFRDCGIARIQTLEAMLEAPALFARMRASPDRRKPRVAVVTTTAGGAAMVVDQLGIRGIAAEPPSPETLQRISQAGVEVARARIIDLTLAGTRYDIMKAAMDVLLAAPEYDLIVAVVGSSARFQPELAVQPLIDSAGAEKPLAAFLVPEAPGALARLAAAGIPNFRTPEACGDAIAAAFARRPPRVTAAITATPCGGKGRILDEIGAYALLEQIGIPHAPAIAVEARASNAPSLPFAYPVAVKVLSEKIAHKSEAQGVVLNVRDGGHLMDAVAQIRARVETKTGAPVERVLIQQMAAGIGEVLIGYRQDSQVGPIVMLAAGGVMTEIYRDRAIRLAPVDTATAYEMIQEVKALRALEGFRGKERGDLAALARAIVALSGLASVTEPVIAEAEVNPLIVSEEGKGVLAVDALVRLA
jgi:acyl-CoA synthetase (NDP forming)